MTQTSPAAEKASPNDELNRAIEELRGALHEDDKDPGSKPAAAAATPAKPSAASEGVATAPGGMNSALIMNIPVEVQIVLGSTEMPVSDLMALQKGSTVSLNRRIGEPVDVVVNGRRIARGEITVLEGDSSRFGIKLTEIIASAKPAG
ncbi:MAG: flagellar motor switch protein FliN [Alphaproteobacteria bacterium]|jgi:flagellar motor switch protein FliN|nr:flagellar motor switch protein FliN [Alphaproteobacteria bacterium]MBU0803261.1 flagellar motor switch protein FliN [Alphaproteobacteria bacterium]MBU0870785.1 flagellar motor switch protein FliN [Alphaproteobacteria bacterium]MBU1403777.1 flagellar motor switch protein FliN [Alphaproteobacteria bacterium]MBU1589612.1 flagellar motor switch protein FliN [Alphaproteobacteria bacterium]